MCLCLYIDMVKKGLTRHGQLIEDMACIETLASY